MVSYWAEYGPNRVEDRISCTKNLPQSQGRLPVDSAVASWSVLKTLTAHSSWPSAQCSRFEDGILEREGTHGEEFESPRLRSDQSAFQARYAVGGDLGWNIGDS